MKIYLIGMPGSGKSTLGRELAARMNLPFIDLDDAIEQQEKMPISQIFSEKGEGYFRQVESSVLNQFAQSPNDFVIATGGGAPCFHDGITVINNSGISVYLDVPLEALVKRTVKAANRPLLQGDVTERLSTLMNNRQHIYRQAKVIIRGGAIKTDEIIDIISRAGM